MTSQQAGVELILDDGTDLAAKINPRLVSLRLTEKREGEADEFELTLQNADGELAVPEPGRVLTLALGWLSGDHVPLGLVDKGRFTIAEVGMEGPPDVVIVKGQSADLTGPLRQRRTKSWKDTTLGAILREIARRHGRTAQIAAGLADLAIAAIEQEGKSDSALVADLGRRYDAIATWKDGKLIFLPIGQSTNASGVPLAGATLRKRDGWRWTFTQAERENYDGASAQWQDQDAGRRRTVSTGGENRRKLKRVYATEAEARQAAQSAKARAGRAPFTFTYDLAIADPHMQPDMRVTLSGWGPKVDGMAWLVKGLTTDFGPGGLRQSIEMESA